MIREHHHTVGTAPLCLALGEPRSSWYRFRKPPTIPKVKSPSFRRLRIEEERRVLDVLNSERFRDMAPAEIYATLLDEGIFICSVSTMYRILSRNRQSIIRRQAPPRIHTRPELLATRPNQLWSWDITKFKGPTTWTYFYLYKIMDVFSRYVVGWMVAYKESASLAEDLIAQTCLNEAIQPGQLTIHADRGSSMTSKAVSELLIDLGVIKTHARPHVSNDNPYSESAFKTLKYRPDFPDRFGSIEDARLFCRRFFAWYNNEHRHSGIALMTPLSVHNGTHTAIANNRQSTLTGAYHLHPERFVRSIPKVKLVPDQVWINKPAATVSLPEIVS